MVPPDIRADITALEDEATRLAEEVTEFVLTAGYCAARRIRPADNFGSSAPYRGAAVRRPAPAPPAVDPGCVHGHHLCARSHVAIGARRAHGAEAAGGGRGFHESRPLGMSHGLRALTSTEPRSRTTDRLRPTVELPAAANVGSRMRRVPENPTDHDHAGESAAADGPTERDVDLAGRNLLGAGRAAAAAGDAGAARAFLTAAMGSEDPAVAGEAANALAEAEAMDAHKRAKQRREG